MVLSGAEKLTEMQSMEQATVESLLLNLIKRTENTTSDNRLLELFSSEKNYYKHVKKRLNDGDIVSEEDYKSHTFNVIANGKTITIAQSNDSSMISGKMQIEVDGWVVILTGDGKIVTSYPRNHEKATFEQNHKSFGDTVYEQPINERFREVLKKLFA